MHLQHWQWVVALVGAFSIGLSKTGIAGLGILAAAMFAIALPTRQSVGVVLPILICGDIVAVSAYWRDAVWSHLGRLLPWAALGVILGWLALGHINDSQVSHLIGGALLVLVVLQGRQRIVKRHTAPSEVIENTEPRSPLYAPIIGIAAGFATMIANAAGPIMILYLLTARLPKLQFIGTSAWCFLTLNLFKIPFSYQVGLINAASLPVDAVLAPFAVLGALAGKPILRRIRQEQFELIALALTLAAALRLLLHR